MTFIIIIHANGGAPRSRMVNTLAAAINISSSTRNLIMNDIYKIPSWQVKLEIGAVRSKKSNPT
jgi:ABC-type uncharacterized transport system ATPase component